MLDLDFPVQVTDGAAVTYTGPIVGEAENPLDAVQTELDIIGLVPGAGEPADALNAIIYFCRGDAVNGWLSVASVIPLGGWAATGTKVAIKSAKALEKADDIYDATKVGSKASPYSHLEDSASVGAGKKFTPAQKTKILDANRERNGGIVKSDLSGQELVKPSKSQKGITPSQNEWQIDHMEPKDAGGSNSYSNAQVLSRKENRDKWDK